MCNFMLVSGINILFVYICCASALSVPNFIDYKSLVSPSREPALAPSPNGKYRQLHGVTSARHFPTLIGSSVSSLVVTNSPTGSYLDTTDPLLYTSNLEDLLNKRQEQFRSLSDLIGGLDTNSQVNQSDSSINSLDYSVYSPSNNNNNNNNGELQAETSNVNAKSVNGGALGELDNVEMHTNNHQSSGVGHHSRHYGNTYSNNHANSMSLPATIKHYGKYIAHSGSPSVYSNSLNLNYIHSLLTKPSTSSASALSSLLNSNPSPSSLASPYGITIQNGYNSASSSASSSSSSSSSSLNYYSAPSTNTNLPSNQQKQHQTWQQQQQSSIVGSNQQDGQQNLTSSIDFWGSSMCGRQQVGSMREPRIVGGNTTYEGEFPWAVSIQRHGNHHCGGVIVGRRWVLTAAHCVRSQLVGNLIVRTGGHTLTRSANHINSHLERDFLVDQIVMHDDFSRYDNLTASQMKSSANTNNADIALLKLRHDIHWNEFVWPVCFPNSEAGNFSGHDAVVIGWGKLNEKSEDFSNELQKVKLTIIDNKVCQNWFRQAGRDMPIDERIICAGFKNGGKDACHGDSGGPLLSKINGHYVVVGVVSTGIGCARPLLPGLYSRVSSYIGWIERYVGVGGF